MGYRNRGEKQPAILQAARYSPMSSRLIDDIFKKNIVGGIVSDKKRTEMD